MTLTDEPSQPLKEFQQKFRTAEVLITEFDHWLWTVRAVQSTVGAGVLSLKRYASQFGELSAEEAAELADASKAIEAALQATFQPDKMNYLMLMMVDPHVHFHVLPRYAEPRSFAEIEWKDTGWPGIPVLGGEASTDEVLHTIRDRLRSTP